MTRPVIVPVNLGCCPEDTRCVLCAVAPNAVEPEVIEALIGHYRDEVANGAPLRVAFFGGPPPTQQQLLATGELPVSARVRPDLLNRAGATLLKTHGCVAIELDALSLHDRPLRESGRNYRGETVLAVASGVRDMGMRVGVVLAPGLPGSDEHTCADDAKVAVPRFDFARLHPVLVLAGSELERRHMHGRYEPLTVDDAVRLCRVMVDELELGGVEVIRVGLQPGPDGFGRAVAGPKHSSLRELVEARRRLDGLRAILDGQQTGPHLVIRCAPADETRTRGPCNEHLRALREEFGLKTVRIVPDPDYKRGRFTVELRESA